jgi:hypothetical protein
VGVRNRFRAAIEAAVPWFDVELERRRLEASDAQMAESRRIRAAATRALHASRRERAIRGYIAYAHRVRR